MARLAMRVKEQKRVKMAKRHDAKRKELRAASVNMKLSDEERQEARTKLNKLPKNSAPTRQRNRCALTGRARGYLGKFGLCRNEFRRLASFGQIPGVTKSSW
ncbi:MAG TPA: 30S ribosomal protein S14 [Bdellovibrionales bacterium]|nr:30S ribosomal protein S14 [Bdellovibrionales bacterium]